MRTPLEFPSIETHQFQSLGLHFSQVADLAPLSVLLEECFGEVPDSSRLAAAQRIGILTKDGDLVAGAVLELLPDNVAYLWLLAVRERNRGQGLGRLLLSTLVDLSRAQGCQAIRLKTYQRWQGMRRTLLQTGWSMLAAELSDRNDRVGEVWQKALSSQRIPVVVIGCNPQGRGGEWANKIISSPDLWDLRAVIDPDPSVYAHWTAAQIPIFPDIQSFPWPEKISAAVVAVPPGLSAGIQRACFAHGWAALVEKPLAASLSELMDLQEDYSRFSIRLVAGVQRRSHPSYVALKALLEGVKMKHLSIRIALGKPEGDSLSGHRADSRLCRGGALIDLGYHALDLAHFLVGEPLEMVACSLRDHGDVAKGIESAADVLGRAGRTWVRIQVDRHGGSKKEEVFADTPEGSWLADRERVIAPDKSVAYSCEGSWSLAENGRLSELAVCCARGSSRPADLWEHISTLGIIEQAYGLADQLGVKGA